MINKIKKIYLKNKEIVHYLIAGGLTTLVSVGSYALFRFIINNYKICTVLSWIAAVTFAYFINKGFVFNSKTDKKMLEFAKFVFARLLTLGIELLTMFVFVDLLKINDFVSKIIVQFVIVVLNYVFSKIFVFNKK